MRIHHKIESGAEKTNAAFIGKRSDSLQEPEVLLSDMVLHKEQDFWGSRQKSAMPLLDEIPYKRQDVSGSTRLAAGRRKQAERPRKNKKIQTE